MDKFTTFLDATPQTQAVAFRLTAGAERPLAALRKLALIRRANRGDDKPYVGYLSDLKNYGKIELWTSPNETLERGSGDCEDMAFLICSMANSLPNHLGPDEIRVGIGKVDRIAILPFIMGTLNGMYHAWAEARIGNNWYIIDGVSGKVHSVPDRRYQTTYAINEWGMRIIRGW
jgi:transglutaminase-like putative cysteine protease